MYMFSIWLTAFAKSLLVIIYMQGFYNDHHAFVYIMLHSDIERAG